MSPKKYKVLFVSHTANLGGAENVLYRFLAEASQFSAEVFLPQGLLSQKLIEIGIPIRISKYLAKLNKEVTPFWILNFIYQFFGGLFELTAYIRRTKPDLLQSNNLFATVYCLIPCLLTQTPLIWHMHDFSSSSSLHRFIARLNSRVSKKVIAVSEAVKRDLLECGVPLGQIVTIYNSISPRWITAENKELNLRLKEFKKRFELVLGVAGTIEERKGLMECAKALAIMSKNKKRNVGLVVAGEPKDSSQKRYYTGLVELIKRENLEKDILFLGNVNEMKTFFSEIDLFLHFPAKPDPLPTVILEAISLRCPVVVGSSGGNQEVIGYGKWGKSVPSGDIEKLVDILETSDFSPICQKEYNSFLALFSNIRKEEAHMSLYKSVVEVD